MTDPTIEATRRRRVNPFVAVIVVALLAMWGYVVYLAFFVGRADSPDKIDEPAFVSEAETRCAEALSIVETLPLPETQVGDPTGRADTIEAATAEFDDMVGDLRVLTDRLVVDPESARIVGLWLNDWDTVVADRFDYATRLRVDPEARLLVTPGPNGRQVSLQVDEFAGTNDMPSCKHPLDA
ncbi:MAG TPA: hypothetical protein VMW08_08620 [Acidimicrobiales bacterium]|nr:hypothetical protein [Acidimicrobiales bacterium]